jgi:hypothetical protein
MGGFLFHHQSPKAAVAHSDNRYGQLVLLYLPVYIFDVHVTQV